MTDDAQGINQDFTALTCGIVAAYVSNNHVATAELPALLRDVHGALIGLIGAAASSSAPPIVKVEKLSPAQIRSSVRRDGIVSYINGKTYKTLKRHLTSYGLNPHSYRERYGLPADYPMVALGYAEYRSALAKSIGLGRVGGMASLKQPSRKAA